MSQGDRRVPRGIQNAETGRYAHACPDLDQEFPLEDCQGETRSLIAERETTHGSFDDNARVGQHLRWMCRQQAGWKGLDDVQREALDMIACKISRVLSGQGGFKDHWDDIAGYARLVSDRCHDAKP